MGDEKRGRLSRRAFVRTAGTLAGGLLLGPRFGLTGEADPLQPESASESGELPRRVLGKTKEKVTVLALGTAPCGSSRSVTTPEIVAIVREALDSGINVVDTSPVYGNAEEGIGEALGRRRDQVFLTTKVWADDAAGAQPQLESSLRKLRTDHVDLVYLHSVGNRDVKRATGPEGALTYLLEQKKAGKTRFVGISGHSHPGRFVPLIESDQIDVVMMAMNFVDRHVYGFEEKVLPVAREHKLGVLCMKIFAGIRGGFGKYGGPNPGPQMDPEHLQLAVRDALELPGVASLVIGVHTVEQVRENVKLVKGYQALSPEEKTRLVEVGRRLAGEWGPHYGPVQ